MRLQQQRDRELHGGAWLRELSWGLEEPSTGCRRGNNLYGLWPRTFWLGAASRGLLPYGKEVLDGPLGGVAPGRFPALLLLGRSREPKGLYSSVP